MRWAIRRSLGANNNVVEQCNSMSAIGASLVLGRGRTAVEVVVVVVADLVAAARVACCFDMVGASGVSIDVAVGARAGAGAGAGDVAARW